MKKNMLFIVGAAKSGTTSLASYLDHYEGVSVSAVKEPFFFIDGIGIDSREEYEELFAKEGFLYVDASTGYLYDKDCPKRIFEYCNRARILIVLRNPIDMAFSYWNYMRANGNESKTILEALDPKERDFRASEEFKRSCFNWDKSYLYVERASYYQQVLRYLDVFGKTHVKVVLLEEMIENKDSILRSICEFSDIKYDPCYELQKENVGAESTSKFLKYLRFGNLMGLRPLIRRCSSPKARFLIAKSLKKIGTKQGVKYVLSKQDRLLIKPYFESDVAQLKNLLGESKISQFWKDFN